ncbi:hypothetical protein [Bifidobacterium simiarum]|uniref:hypothetical protein n=1 Tax=Bifidobacterium simiarum TaxID=2045441 RepID=UPI001BDD0ACC|nr:hypothetical protein [Bifidobacterium simiarum]MBT1166968.1 hypothetical protein [Bifidobacterium simiarum]
MMRSISVLNDSRSARQDRFSKNRGHRMMAPWFPLPGGLLAVLWCIVFLLTIAGSDFFRPWPPVTWSDVESRMRESQIPVILVATFVGALLADPLRDDSMIGARCGARPIYRQIIRMAAGVWLVVTSAYVIGFLPLCQLTWAYLQWDGFVLLPLIVIAISVGMWPVLGLCGGVLLRNRPRIVAGLTTAGAVFGSVMIPAAISNNPWGVSFLAPAPIWQLAYPFVGEITSPAVNVSRAVLFSTITGCVIMTAITVLQTDRHLIRIIVSYMTPVALISVALLVLQPNLIAHDGNLRAVCTAAKNSRVCVEHRYRRLLSPIASAVDHGLSRFRPQTVVTVLGPGLITAFDRPISGIPPTSRQSMIPVGVDLESAGGLNEYERKLNEDVANMLADPSACSGEGRTVENQNLQYQLYRWFNDSLNGRDPSSESGPFSAIHTDDQMRIWLLEHDTDVRSCAITERDVRNLR